MSNLKLQAYRSIKLPLVFATVLWLIQIVQVILPVDFASWGVYPRTAFGLRGILFSPLIHGSFGHIIANTPPLIALGALMLFFYPKIAIRSFLFIYLVSGLAVWAFARPVFHIGASGLIYGMVAFIFFSGIFRKNIKSIALALLVLFFYSGMFFGILPGQPGISWEGHLLGSLAGILAAFVYKNAQESNEVRPTYSWEQEEQSSSFFLDRDVFKRPKS